eukprot:5331117-Prymnesium_polylepis.2
MKSTSSVFAIMLASSPRLPRAERVAARSLPSLVSIASCISRYSAACFHARRMGRELRKKMPKREPRMACRSATELVP